jgi:Protein of unknown function (DUF3093)
MRVYHERLSVPLVWWLLGLATIFFLATEVIPGWPLPIEVIIYVVLVGAFAALLWNWGRTEVEVGAGELRVGLARLPLTAVGEVTALDEAQTRSLRGPRGDPAALLIIRPYLRRAVYVEIADPRPHGGPLTGQDVVPVTPHGRRPGALRRVLDHARDRAGRRQERATRRGLAAPYWLISTRHPDSLAAAIEASRPAARPDGAAMG